jgi:hypothetical protein
MLPPILFPEESGFREAHLRQEALEEGLGT